MNDLVRYFARLGFLGTQIKANNLGATEAIDSEEAFTRAVGLSLVVKSNDGRVIFVGNGGSAAIASHMATDWLKNGGFAALCFNDGPQLTCLTNDLGYEQSFALPVERHGREGDLLIAISSSGKSPNILAAVAAARAKLMHVITLSGFEADNPLRKTGDINFWLPDNRYGFVEIGHLTICHAILDLAIAVWEQNEHRPNKLYRDMLRIRMIEEEIATRYADQKMRCPIHLSVGQEAVAVGVSAALRPSDQIVSTHRCHAHYLAKGGDLKTMICEMMGREAGCCGGRGGSMHLFDPLAGVLVSVPIVGASIPIGVGAAFAMKYKGTDDVSVVYMGDAAVEEGAFHESLNFAALRKLPVIFVCEDNLYAGYSPLHERQPERPILGLAQSHGIEAQRVDGNDVLAVRDAMTVAVAKARAGNGPSFIEATTYRLREHCGPNFDHTLGYRTPEEFEAWKATDPLLKLQPALSSTINTLRQEITAEIAEAFAFAEAAPFPDPETAGDHVYAG